MDSLQIKNMSDRVSLESSGGMYMKRRTASTLFASLWGPWIWPWRFFSEAAPHSQACRWMDVKFVWPQLQLLLFIVEPKAKASTIKQQHPHVCHTYGHEAVTLIRSAWPSSWRLDRTQHENLSFFTSLFWSQSSQGELFHYPCLPYTLRCAVRNCTLSKGDSVSS